MIKNNGCCDLEYAKELKELGCKQESIWYWSIIQRRKVEANLVCGRLPRRGNREYISTFTCAELLESLPKTIIYENKTYWIYLSSGSSNEWYADYYNDSYAKEDKEFLSYHENVSIYLKITDKFPQNTLAKLKIWLIKNNHIKVEEEK